MIYALFAIGWLAGAALTVKTDWWLKISIESEQWSERSHFAGYLPFCLIAWPIGLGLILAGAACRSIGNSVNRWVARGRR